MRHLRTIKTRNLKKILGNAYVINHTVKNKRSRILSLLSVKKIKVYDKALTADQIKIMM